MRQSELNNVGRTTAYARDAEHEPKIASIEARRAEAKRSGRPAAIKGMDLDASEREQVVNANWRSALLVGCCSRARVGARRRRPTGPGTPTSRSGRSSGAGISSPRAPTVIRTITG